MNKKQITLMVWVVAVTALPQRGLVAQEVGYANYKNGRYGYELRYPPNLLHPEPESQNGDGRSFTSPDGSAKLSCWGAIIHENESIQTLYQRDLATHPGASYKVLRAEWFVISGEADGRIFYEKAVVRGNFYAAFLFEYSRSSKQTYDPVVSWISKSFNYGAERDPTVMASPKPHFELESLHAGMTKDQVTAALGSEKEEWALNHCSYTDRDDFMCYYHNYWDDVMTVGFSKASGRLILFNLTMQLRGPLAKTWSNFQAYITDQLGQPTQEADNPNEFILKQADWVSANSKVTLSIDVSRQIIIIFQDRKGS